jgi:LysM repeat protein
MNKKVHKVAKGETLWGISKHYGIPLKNLADWNNLTGRLIHNINIGQKIYLYPPQEEIDTFLTIRLLDLAFNPINTATLNLEYDGLKKEVKILDFLQKTKNDQRFVCFLSRLKSHVLLS